MRDVVVVGAGLAGLTAARLLADAGRDVEVWEARDRVGGRTLTQDLDGVAVDLGAQWLGPAQHRMHALADRFGLTRFDTHTGGDALVVDSDRTHRYRGTVPLLGPVQLARMGAALAQFRALSLAAAAGRPLRDRALAGALDATAGDGAARRVVDTAVRVIFGEEPSQLSTGWVAAYAASAGGNLLDLAAIEGGAQQTRLVGGTQAFSVALAAGLDVVLDRPLIRLEQRSDHVVLTAADGTTVQARRAVLALPPTLLGRIEHDPALPLAQRIAPLRMRMGATAKVVAFYDEAFWRDDGLRGEAVLTEGPVQVTFDNSGPDGEAPALLAFLCGDAARDAARRPDSFTTDAVTAALVRAFGERAARPTTVVQQHWNREVWTDGCPTANVTPGPGSTGVRAETLRTAAGRVHLAGTETASEWRGYMEGAVQSGEHAAAEISAAEGWPATSGVSA